MGVSPRYSPIRRAVPRPERHPRRWLVLAIVLVAEVMDLIDGTRQRRGSVDSSRPRRQRRDPFNGSAAYTLAFAVLLVTGARLGDLIDRGDCSRSAWLGSPAPRSVALPLRRQRS
jgi:hypothetical protein